MFRDNTDKSWEILGKTAPYYGVLTSNKYRDDNINDEAKALFFKSGQEHMIGLLNRVQLKLGTVLKGSALDFGCGVGRLIFPLAELGFSRVVGIDVSESMLKEAKGNAEKFRLRNISLLLSDDSLSNIEGCFDFIHSFIVFQHIPVTRGERIIRQLIDRLSPGGVAALQMPFARKVGLVRKSANFVRVHILPLHILANVIQKKPWREPPMQMNRYNMNSLLQIAHDCGVRDATIELIFESGNLGAYLFLKKPP